VDVDGITETINLIDIVPVYVVPNVVEIAGIDGVIVRHSRVADTAKIDLRRRRRRTVVIHAQAS